MPGVVTTPGMRRRLRALAALAGFVAFVIAIAFIAAFRNTGGGSTDSTRVQIDTAGLREGEWHPVRAVAEVVLDGQQFHALNLIVVRAHGRVHALWAHSTHLGCRVVPRHEGTQTVLEDPCGGSSFAIDGRCLSGPCPRNLDEFAIVERDGLAYADLARLERGAQRGA